MRRAFDDGPPLPVDLRAGLDGAACLGAWSHDVAAGRLRLAPPLLGLIGVPAQDAEVGLAQMLAGLHPGDRLRVESMLQEAGEDEGPFEAVFRTRPDPRGTRLLRLMGRSETDAGCAGLCIRGLAFDLTEGLEPAGAPDRRAQRQVNQIAGHAVAMLGLAGRLSDPRMSSIVERFAEQVGSELARHLNGARDRRPH